jgi:hypothetical protein
MVPSWESHNATVLPIGTCCTGTLRSGHTACLQTAKRPRRARRGRTRIMARPDVIDSLRSLHDGNPKTVACTTDFSKSRAHGDQRARTSGRTPPREEMYLCHRPRSGPQPLGCGPFCCHRDVASPCATARSVDKRRADGWSHRPGRPGKTLAEATTREEPSGNSALYLRDHLHGNATEPLLVARLYGA